MKDAPAQGLGTVLKNARQAAGLSEQQVADTLRLLPSVVRTLEADDFQSLPALAYVRGYVRAYARLLELDAEALLCEHEQCLGGVPVPRLVITDSGRTPLRDLLHDRLGWVFGGAALVVGLVASGVLWWAWPQESAAPLARSASTPTTGQTPASAPSPGSSVAPASSQTRVPAETTGLAAAVAVPSTGTPDAAPPPVPSVVNATEETVAGGEGAPAAVALTAGVEGDGTDAAEPTPVAGQGRALSFAFTEDCWVEVFDRTDRVLHRALNRAGETLLLRGETPLRIRLGNAPGVSLEYDGHAVALAPHTRNRVANLVLE